MASLPRVKSGRVVPTYNPTGRYTRMAKLPGAGFAQSGGISSTFGGGKGGSAYGAGATKSKAKGAGKNATGAAYTIHSDGGDKTPTGLSGVALHASGTSMGGSKQVTRNYRKPANG